VLCKFCFKVKVTVYFVEEQSIIRANNFKTIKNNELQEMPELAHRFNYSFVKIPDMALDLEITASNSICRHPNGEFMFKYVFALFRVNESCVISPMRGMVGRKRN